VRSPYRLFAILAMILLGVLLASPAGAQTLTVPLNIDGPRIFVKVLVNDRHARLLLDTGAGMALVGPQFAKGTTELHNASTLSSRQALVGPQFAD